MSIQKKEENKGWEDFSVTQKQATDIIGIAGFAQSGKDTAGRFLINNFGYQRLSFADALREGLYALNPIVTYEVEITPRGFWEWVMREPLRSEVREIRLQEIVDDIGWDSAKTKYPEVRNLLQRYGTEAGRNIHGDDCWTKIIKKQIKEGGLYVITDVRFPNELKFVESLGGTVVKIHNPRVQSVNSHVSDKELEGVDYIIDNSGSMEDFENSIIKFLEGRVLAHVA